MTCKECGQTVNTHVEDMCDVQTKLRDLLCIIDNMRVKAHGAGETITSTDESLFQLLKTMYEANHEMLIVLENAFHGSDRNDSESTIQPESETELTEQMRQEIWDRR